MPRPSIQSRIFLVGCGRSGTTLLQSMLASHSRIASMPETWFFVTVAGYMTPRLYGYAPAGVKDRLVRLRDRLRLALGFAAKSARGDVRDFLTRIGRDELMALFPSAGRSLGPQLRACVDILDRMAEDAGRPIWLEKSPLHLGYVDLIERTLPEARFVHLVRRGPDVVASLYEATQRYVEPWLRTYPTLDHCIDQWNHCVILSSKHVRRPRHTLVHYEELTSDPEGTLRRLCQFAGVEFEGAMLDEYGPTSSQLRRHDEPWKAGTSEPIRNANGAKFQSLFDEEKRRHILARLVPLPEHMRQG